MKGSEVENARVDKERAQLSLFPVSPREVCAEVGLNWLAALRLRDAGWLSFDPEAIGQLHPAQEEELRFLGSLVAAGCDERMLEQLLQGLNKPYTYQIRAVYYVWDEQRWKLLPPEIPTQEMVARWIEAMVAEEDIVALAEVNETIGEAIARLGGDEDGEEEDEE